MRLVLGAVALKRGLLAVHFRRRPIVTFVARGGPTAVRETRGFPPSISAGPAAARMVVAACTLDPLCLGRRCFLALAAGGNVRRMSRGLSAVVLRLQGLRGGIRRGHVSERRGRQELIVYTVM